MRCTGTPSTAGTHVRSGSWRRTLDGAPALLELPTDRPRPPVESHRGAVERIVLPPATAEGVHALARSEGGTLFMVLLAALDVVLGRLAGQGVQPLRRRGREDDALHGAAVGLHRGARAVRR
ncbi:MAG TPA: condensation domain-containing protein, partial [Longimicrobium sp.]|nr:condensation domain-containing protein [Longimicrobium sp.]